LQTIHIRDKVASHAHCSVLEIDVAYDAVSEGEANPASAFEP